MNPEQPQKGTKGIDIKLPEPGPLAQYGCTLSENDIRALAGIAERPNGNAVLATPEPPLWMRRLAENGYVRVGNAVTMFKVQTGEKIVAITEAGRVALKLFGPLNCSGEDYHKYHAVCPRCFHASVDQTTAGCPGPRDTNRARCNTPPCNWVGIVHDLVPARPELAALIDAARAGG